MYIHKIFMYTGEKIRFKLKILCTSERFRVKFSKISQKSSNFRVKSLENAPERKIFRACGAIFDEKWLNLLFFRRLEKNFMYIFEQKKHTGFYDIHKNQLDSIRQHHGGLC